ncbi:hypothetical protein CBL_10123 [Carabus blaptoides fortunei]
MEDRRYVHVRVEEHNIDEDREKFMVVGLDPMREFRLCIRIINVHIKEIIRLSTSADLNYIARMARYCNNFNHGGASVSVLADISVLLTRNLWTVLLSHTERENIILANSCIYRKICSWCRYTSTNYLKWMQELALKMIMEEISKDEI